MSGGCDTPLHITVATGLTLFPLSHIHVTHFAYIERFIYSGISKTDISNHILDIISQEGIGTILEMNEAYQIRGKSAPWEAESIENVDQSSPMDLYVLEHQLEVCSIPKDAVKDFIYPLIKIAFLPDSRLVLTLQY